MNSINVDTNKIRSYGYEIIKQADDFNKLIDKVLIKTGNQKSKIFNEFTDKLISFGKMYELCADKLEESMLNNKYE